MDIGKKINDIKAILIKEIDPDIIILFGSRANGKSRNGSDIDLAIKTNQTISFRKERKLREKLDEAGGIYSIDLIFTDRVSKKFLKNIKGYGKVIYEKK
ncbi:MAG: nucleotidyltransferase domain-containing protein [Elusimicrobia bacterium]|jgi:predicted nucleotidyltransferase|nr:nucleotidyltransferase domain-containing protein [Elusimicrobiota bacterium]